MQYSYKCIIIELPGTCFRNKSLSQMDKINLNIFMFMVITEESQPLKPFGGEHTWCGRKVMSLATLYTNGQCCCLPLHMAVRLTPAVDSVQV